LFLLGLENSENRMMRNLKNFVYKGQVTGIEETVALIDNVTTDQVNAVISERFNPERQWLFILEPA
jgi:predicted Zn-dependent peptidase